MYILFDFKDIFSVVLDNYIVKTSITVLTTLGCICYEYFGTPGGTVIQHVFLTNKIKITMHIYKRKNRKPCNGTLTSNICCNSFRWKN